MYIEQIMNNRHNFMRVLLVAVLLVFFLTLVFLITNTSAEYDKQKNTSQLIAVEQQQLIRQILKHSVGSGLGQESSFNNLRVSKDRFVELLEKSGLNDSTKDSWLIANPHLIENKLLEMNTGWLELQSFVDKILNNHDSIVSVRRVIDDSKLLLPRLFELSNATANYLVRNGNQSQVYHATHQLFLQQRISASMDEVLSRGSRAANAVDQLTRDLDQLKIANNALINGDPSLKLTAVSGKEAKSNLQTSTTIINNLSESIDIILRTVADLLPALDALSETASQQQSKLEITKNIVSGSELSSKIAATSDMVSEKLSELIHLYDAPSMNPKVGPISIGSTLAIFFGIISLLLLMYLQFFLIRVTE